MKADLDILLRNSNLNQFILEGIKKDLSEPDKKEFRNLVLKSLKENHFSARINRNTRKILESEYGEVYLAQSADCIDYQPLFPEIGITYLPLVAKDCASGIMHRIRIQKTRENAEMFPGQAKRYEDRFREILNIVLDFIKTSSPKPLYINRESYFQDIHFEIINYYGETISEHCQLEGNSLELPLALAILSFLLKVPVPVDKFSTGSLRNDSILHVEGIQTKYKAAISENEEIRQAVLPFGSAGRIADANPDIEILNVRTFKEAVEIYFPDYIEKIDSINEMGFVTYNLFRKKLEGIDIEADEIKFRIAKGEQITPDIVEVFSSFPEKNDTKVLIINNAVVNWFTSSIAVQFKNIYPIIGIYDPKLEDGGIVVIRSDSKSIPLGSILKYSKK